ncbi:TetR/AcrR family transcriptional regulator [Litchfieldia salsa]|uniref:DNA-binding transcriptional regulator, AcrR family n=1 Tax=Litchfieldia salsa TaxID=930152 RepID=A0A1H0U6Q1_9BACI|nr:TetR/AcrR family transcriptional regulator [Litchfieldia salsa]SDP61506.1 DNA-binding transcriptional regulator, AcrR family [Litchfieldia salsa]
MAKRAVHASVKDERLIKKRRDQMIKGAVTLFKEKGYHRTTTREIARAAGFSIGTLYEYIKNKEDILYLVCDSIYDHVTERLEEEINNRTGNLQSLKAAIAHHFKVMDEMQDEVLVMYQEAKSLSKDALPYVLNKENELARVFEVMIRRCIETGELHLKETDISLIAHSIIVQGQMWGFRRWVIQKRYTLEQYIEIQTNLILYGITKKD